MVAALVLAGVVGWVGYAKTKRALEAEEARRAEAKQARADAGKARADAVQAADKLDLTQRMSLQTFEKVFELAGGRPPFGGPGFGPGFGGRGGGGGGFGGFGGGPGSPPPGGGPFMIPLPPGGGPPLGPAAEDRAAVVEEVLKFYDWLAEQDAANAGSPRLQLDAARAHRRTGEAYSWRGNAEKAAASFRRAAELLENLYRRNPADENVRSELAQAYLDAPPDVFPDYERLLTRAMELSRDLPKPPRPNMAGSVLLKLGWAREKAGNRDGAAKAYRDAIPALAASPDGGDVRPPNVVAEQALARSYLAGILANTNRLPEARRVLEESVAEVRVPAGPRPGPGGRQPWELVATTQNQLADVCEKLGDRGAADRARAAAKDAWANLERRDGGFPGGKKDGRPKN